VDVLDMMVGKAAKFDWDCGEVKMKSYIMELGESKAVKFKDCEQRTVSMPDFMSRMRTAIHRFSFKYRTISTDVIAGDS
jgi:hypothetical protein